MEGKFYRRKNPDHPHTNMAKAALNMMTRTCAVDLIQRGIYMNSVDTVIVFSHFTIAGSKTHHFLRIGLDQ